MIDLSFPTVKLGQHICKINTRVKDSNFDSSDIIVYGVTNIEGITVTGQKVSEDIDDYILLRKNQFAFNPYRINVGSLGLFQDDNIGAVSPAYVVFETLQSYDSDFLLFYLKSPLGIKLIKWYGDRGGVRAALRFDDLCNIDVPDISIENQRIFMQNFAVIKTNLNEYNRQLDKQTRYISKLRQSILQQAVEGKLCPQDPNDEPASELLKKIKVEKEQLIKDGKLKKEKPLASIKDDEKPFELPQGWEWCRLGEITQLITSGSRNWSSFYSTTGAKFIRMGNLSRDSFKIKSNNIQHVFLPKQSEGERTQLQKDDILLSITGEVGLMGLVPDQFGEAYTNQHTALVRFDHRVFIKYCAYSMLSPYSKYQFNKPQRGIKNSFRLSDISNVVISLPAFNTQQHIVKKVDSLMSYCDKLEEQVSKSKKYADQLMQSILAKAFNSEKEEKKATVIVSVIPQVSNEPIKLAARGNISEQTMKHIEDTINDMCGDA